MWKPLGACYSSLNVFIWRQGKMKMEPLDFRMNRAHPNGHLLQPVSVYVWGTKAQGRGRVCSRSPTNYPAAELVWRYKGTFFMAITPISVSSYLHGRLSVSRWEWRKNAKCLRKNNRSKATIHRTKGSKDFVLHLLLFWIASSPPIVA